MELREFMRLLKKNLGIPFFSSSPKEILERLYFEGVYPTNKFRSLHEIQLNAFIEWKWKGEKTIQTIFGSNFKTLFSQKR